MSNVVVLGTQFGDEGKGKVVDLLTEKADIIVRFQGGNNAGHTLVVLGETYALHLVPSGILHPSKVSVIAPGVVVDPDVLLQEISELVKRGVKVGPSNLRLSGKAHLILPYHKLLDAAREAPREGGRVRIGTTGRGIGPAYEDKASRQGLRLQDLLDLPAFRAKLGSALLEKNCLLGTLYGLPPLDAGELMAKVASWAESLAPYVSDTSEILREALRDGRNVLFEGAQGTQLDLDHGTYPFVTSSSTVGGGAATGSGVPPGRLGTFVGLVKAYTSRVGEGPFPTELLGATGDLLRDRGKEFGTTTGRPRRCGWLDAVVVRTSASLSGLSYLAVTKLDVLCGLEEIKMATHYDFGGRRLDYLPPETRDIALCEPRYLTFPGFGEDIRGVRSLSDLPRNARDLLDALSSQVGVPIGMVSVGPGRDETIVLKEFF